MTTEVKVSETVEAVKKTVKKVTPKVEGEVAKKAPAKKTETAVKAPKVTEVKTEKPAEVKAEKPAVKKATAPKAVKTEVKPETKAEVKPEVKTEKPAEVKAEIKSEVKAEVKAEKPAVKKAKAVKAVKAEKFEATGKRKKSVARVKLVNGSGVITVNGRNLEQYFPVGTLPIVVKQPLELTQTLSKLDVFAEVFGGGFSGQAGAIRNAIAKALLVVSDTYRAELKKAGYLTRDSRVKERKKYGLKKARKAPQFSKR